MSALSFVCYYCSNRLAARLMLAMHLLNGWEKVARSLARSMLACVIFIDGRMGSS
jgi:hypothetical protein